MAKTVCLKASANKGQIIRIKGRNQGKAKKAGLQIEALGEIWLSTAFQTRTY